MARRPSDEGEAGTTSGSATANGFTSAQQQQVLSQLMSLMTHYLAAVCSSALTSSKMWAREGSMFGKDMTRNEEGEFYVTLGALLACFDATLRRVATDERGVPRPLELTQFFNGTHTESKSEFFDGSLCFNLHSFIGLPFSKLLNETPIRRHGAQRARRQVMEYFASSQFVRKASNPKTPNELGERFNVLLEPSKISSRSSDSVSAKQRTAAFQVDPDAQGQAAGDAIENLAQVLLRSINMASDRDIKPPSYLPFNLRTTVLAPRPPYSTYLHLGGDWEKLGFPEFNHIRDMMMLFKFGLDWMPTIRTLSIGKSRYGTIKRKWGPGVLMPQHVLPGYWTEKQEGEKDQIVFLCWLGQQSFSSSSAVDAFPLRSVEDQGDVEALRRAFGMQCQIHQHMTTAETRTAENKEAERNPLKVLKLIDVMVDEDRVLLHANLPLTVDSGGILSQEEAEKLLTLLAAPFMSLALVLDFFADQRSGHLLNAELAALLEQILFEPQAFQAEPGLKLPPEERADGSVAELSEHGLDEEAAVPVPWEQRTRLGTPNGILYHDLRMRPKAILGALRQLCKEGVAKCVADSSSSYVSLLMLLVRIAMQVEASMLSVLTHLDEDPIEKREQSPCFDEVLEDALPELLRLREEFFEPATSLLEHWIVQVSSDRAKSLRLVLLHAHLILIHGNLFRGWSPNVVSKTYTMNGTPHAALTSGRTVLRMAPSTAFVVLWAEGATQEDLKDSTDQWMLRLIRGSALMPHVFATMQESRAAMMAASSVDELASGRVHIWFERTVSVAHRQHSGGEPFPPKDAEKAPDPEGWESVGRPPIMCQRVVNSPGWQENIPYPPSCDMYFELQFPGADYISIEFHADTELEEGSDYITFFRDSTMTAHFGERRRYSGQRQKEWPGVAGVAPLVISSDHAFVHFHSDASVGGKGFRFTAEAPVSEAKATQLLATLQSLMRTPGDEAVADASGGGGAVAAEEDDETFLEQGDIDDTVNLFACRLALQATDNVLERALAYLHSNHEKLREGGRKIKLTLEKQGAEGIFRNRLTALQVNLQTGELVVGGKAMLPIPAHIAAHHSFNGPMGTRVPLCSIISHDDDGEWLHISGDQRLDGADVEVFAHRVKLAELPETYRAKHEREQLRKVMAMGALVGVDAEGDPASSTPKLRLHAAVLQLVREGSVPGLHAGAVNPDDFAERCVAALAELGVAGLESVRFLDEADGAHLVTKLPELELPVVRRHFVSRLQQIKLTQQEASVEGLTNDQPADGPWLIGGHDERPKPPPPPAGMPPYPFLCQEEGGLNWCGRSYKPFHPLAAPSKSKLPPWRRRFETKLFSTVTQGEFFEVRDRLLFWEPRDSAQPHSLLMYCPPVGEPIRTIGHRGMLYEIGPLHEHEYSLSPDALSTAAKSQTIGSRWINVGPRRPMTGNAVVSSALSAALGQGKLEFTLAELEAFKLHDLGHDSFVQAGAPGEEAYYEPDDHTWLELEDEERYGVWVLWPSGLHSYEKRMVYSNDVPAALTKQENHEHVLSVDFGEGKYQLSWLPKCREEGGRLLDGLLDVEGNLQDNIPGLGGRQNEKITGVVLKRVRSPLMRAADVAALEPADLIHIDAEEWDYQLNLPSANLYTLLPEPLTSCFGFWRTSPTTIWGYRFQYWVDARADEEKEAQRGSKSVYRTEWYDGYAIHITLGEAQTLLVRRLNWVSPLAQKEGEEERWGRGPPCLTLINASRCSPGSTVRRLLKLLRRLASEASILFWTQGALQDPGDTCSIHSIEIPAMELVFKPSEVWLPGAATPATRYVCEDLKSMWLAEEPNQKQLQMHLDGLPIGLWLQSADHEYALLMPNVKLRRYKFYRCPLMDDTGVSGEVKIYDREYREHGIRCFMYPLHASGSYLRTNSIADALYLAYCRLITRRYAMVPPLIEAAFKDTPYEHRNEAPLVSWMLAIEDRCAAFVWRPASVHCAKACAARAAGYRPSPSARPRPQERQLRSRSAAANADVSRVRRHYRQEQSEGLLRSLSDVTGPHHTRVLTAGRRRASAVQLVRRGRTRRDHPCAEEAREAARSARAGGGCATAQDAAEELRTAPTPI